MQSINGRSSIPALFKHIEFPILSLLSAQLEPPALRQLHIPMACPAERVESLEPDNCPLSLGANCRDPISGDAMVFVAT